MQCDLIGWDIGGAHLKAAAVADGRIVAVIQQPCPLWLGLDRLHQAVEAILQVWTPPPDCRHAVTMTGELADLFDNRAEGVSKLIASLTEHIPPERLRIFAGTRGWRGAERIHADDAAAIASANWLATGYFAASAVPQALLIDIGSTTTDLMLLRDGSVLADAYTDFERLRCDELLYHGIVRTPLMAIAERAPFDGEWIGVMAEHFATTADVYRILGQLPEHADQMSAADGGDKSRAGSIRRLARMVGRDGNSADAAAWQQLARYFRERQIERIQHAVLRHLSRGLFDSHVPFIGAGIGRFLVQELARRLEHPYLDFVELFPLYSQQDEFHIADCAPAAAVACLARPWPCLNQYPE